MKEDDFRYLRLLHLVTRAGQKVLMYTFTCGTKKKSSSITLLDYLDNLPNDSTANYKNVRDKSKLFNKTETDQINKYPTCTNFDVSLLTKAIKYACEEVADPNKRVSNGVRTSVSNVNVWTSPTPLVGFELEHYVGKIKETRNTVVHEYKPLTTPAFLNEIQTLLTLFDNCLSATKIRYPGNEREYQVKKDAVQKEKDDVMSCGVEEMLQKSAVSLLPDFKVEIDQELEKVYDGARYLTPLHFLSEIPEDRVKVSDIFCDITLTEERGMAQGGGTHKVPYLEVLRLCEGITTSTLRGARPSGQVRPQVLVVEGEAGSGKTTWACYMVQQWLTPQNSRHVQGLDRYELLLRVVCRERSSPTLESLVQQLLPESYIRYNRLLLPLLKKCRVLIVIDGIDEKNEVTDPLVSNILSEAVATTFTIVCTSRPHSVHDLKAEARFMKFQVSHVRMLGISDDKHRIEVVVKHYQWLRPGANTDALRQAVEDIVWREVFKLPLNLLFLATMYFFNPRSVSTSLCPNDLYQNIHTWCTEKLQDRLRAPYQAGLAWQGALSLAEWSWLGALSQVGWAWLWAPFQAGWAWLGAPFQAGWAFLGALFQTGWTWLRVPKQARWARVFRQAQVDKVLDVIYKLALEGLLQDRLFLNDQDLKEVTDACTERLDPSVVLSAFYSMRREVTASGVKETYMAPHKSLQEFMAAKSIAGHIKQYSEGAIEHVLRMHTAGRDPTLRQLRQTLVHLLCLLTQQGDAMTEAVHLLYKAGVTRTNEWLDLLADAMAPDAVVQHAAEQLEAWDLHEVTFSDKHLLVASVMLQYLTRRKVEVWLHRKLANLNNLAQVLADHKMTELHLEYHWRLLHQPPTPTTLLQHLPRNDLQWFSGHLDTADLVLLPECLKWLCLAVKDSDHARCFLPALTEAVTSLPNLLIIKLHIPVASVTHAAAALTQLPAGYDFSLYLSGMNDQLVGAARDILVAMCPPEPGFRSLFFPEATVGLREWKDLFTELQMAGVRVRCNVLVPDKSIDENEERQLDTHATAIDLGCRWVYRVSNEDMWLWQ